MFRPTPKGFDGSIKLGLGTQLKEKASLSLQAVIIDTVGCEGPRSVTKVPGKKVSQLIKWLNSKNMLFI